MNVINPVLRKVLVELEGLNYPLEFWWDDELIYDFEKILNDSKNRTIRAHNTPNSIIEFHLSQFKTHLITKTTEVIPSGCGTPFTQIAKYYKSLFLSQPNIIHDGSAEFPNTLICHLNKRTEKSTLLDFSSQITLDILVAKDIEIADYFENRIYPTIDQAPPIKLVFAEYAFLQ